MRKSSFKEDCVWQFLIHGKVDVKFREKLVDVFKGDFIFITPTVRIEKCPHLQHVLLGYKYRFYVTLSFLRYNCRIGVWRWKTE